jgi:hypothetical protein
MDHHMAYNLGASYARFGSMGDALRRLRESALTGFPCYPWNARDPVLAPMRHHTDGGRLLTELRSAWEQCLRRNVAEPASFRHAAGGKR